MVKWRKTSFLVILIG